MKLVVLSIFALGATALAEPPHGTYIRVPAPPVGRTDGPASLSSRTIYLNRCVGGCTVFFSNNDDSRTGASSIADGTRTIPEFAEGDQVWSDLVQCVKDTYAPYNVTVTDVRPPSTQSYFENLVGGKGSDLRADLQNAGGVSPFTCGEIPNAITYTFDVYGPDALSLCWTAAQETAHAFGLDHEYLTKDPMTYLQGELPKRFRDVDSPCGTFSMMPCQCGRTKQNSYRMIVGLLGPTANPIPPEVSISYPTADKKTQPGFTVRAKATDTVRVEKVEVYIDGALAGMATTPVTDIFDVATSRDIAQGSHQMEVRAYNVQGATQSAMMDFEQGPPCKPDGCDGTDVCADGVCVPGPDAPGGLGAVCTGDTECISHQCVNGGEDLMHCVMACDVGSKTSCPSHFECLDTGSGGVCWFTGGGCCQTGTGPQGPILLGLGASALLLRRRRRRP